MPEDFSPLSLDSALGLMREAAPSTEDNTAGVKPANEPAKAEPEIANSEEKSDASADHEPAKEADKNTPPEDEGKTDDEAETGDVDALPPIEPPSSWKTEEKEVFKSLPRAAQEAIQRREQDRTTELRKLQNSSADERKAVDAEVNRLKGLSEKISSHVQSEVKALARDFPEIKTETDVIALASRDPARFSIFQARLMEFNATRQAEAEAQGELTQRANVQQREQVEGAKTALLDAFPAWSDPAVARKEVTELQDYVIAGYKVSEQAARTALDPIVYQLAQKAMLYDRAQKAKADAIKRDPPRVNKPGTQSSSPKADAKAADRQTRLNRLTKTGSFEDALELLRA